MYLAAMQAGSSRNEREGRAATDVRHSWSVSRAFSEQVVSNLCGRGLKFGRAAAGRWVVERDTAHYAQKVATAGDIGHGAHVHFYISISPYICGWCTQK